MSMNRRATTATTSSRRRTVAVALLAAGAGAGDGGEGGEGGVQVEVLPVVQFAEIEDAAWEGGEEPQVAFGKLDLDSVACLMHSSGALFSPRTCMCISRARAG